MDATSKSPTPTMKKTINWGGVIKGVAMVTAAVVVGWAVFQWAAPAVAAYLAGGSTGAQIANTALGGVIDVGQFIGHVAAQTWGVFSSAAVSFGGALGIDDLLSKIAEGTSTALGTVQATALAAKDSIGTAAAGAAATLSGAGTLMASKIAFGAPHLIQMVPMDTGHHGLDPTTLAKAGHAAVHDHPPHHPRENVAQAARTSASWADKVGGSKAAQGSFAEQVDASRAMPSEHGKA